MNYRTILIAYDFSASAERALAKGMELARQYSAEPWLIHVVDYLPPVDTTFGSVSSFEVDLTDQLVASAEKRLAELAEQNRIKPANCRVEVGSPKLEIIRVAESVGADLIVMGSHGRHGLGRLLGSTAAGVVNHATCDVLAVRLPESP